MSPGVRLRGLAARAGPDVVELAERLRGQRDLGGVQTPGQLVCGAGADDGDRDGRLMEQPRQRDVGRCLTEAAAQRAVRNQPQTEVAQGRNDLELDRAGGQVVATLLRHQAHEVAGRAGALGHGDLPPGEVAAADVDDLAGGDELLYRLPDLLPRRTPVDVVHLVQVDVVGLEPTEAVLTGLPDVVRRQAAVVGSGAHRLVDLGGQHDLVPASMVLGQPAADVLLGDPVALLHVRGLRPAVHVGRVDEVDTRVEGGVEHGQAVLFADLHAKIHGAQPDPADLQAGPAQIAVVHAHPSSTAGSTDLLASIEPTTTQPSWGGTAVRVNGRDSHARSKPI